MTPLTVVRQASLSMGFPPQEYWSRLLSPPPGDLPDSGIERASPALADRFFTTAPPGKPKGKMDEPQTKGVHEKFCGLWTQAELQSRKMWPGTGERGILTTPVGNPAKPLPFQMVNLEVQGKESLGMRINFLTESSSSNDNKEVISQVGRLEWSLRRTGVPGCIQQAFRNV